MNTDFSNIEFVSKSKVELMQHVGDDRTVAKAAWVSNFDTDSSPVKIPDDSHWRLLVAPDQKEWSAWYSNTRDYYVKQEEAYKHIKGLINFLMRNRHMSPFEHGSFTFLVDTPIFVAREFMRHRTWSYNEVSGRYKELKPRFYLAGAHRPLAQTGKIGAYKFEPGTEEQYGTVWAQSTISYAQSWDAYQKMLSVGVAKEVARDVLPVSTMTQFYATANPRNVLQFLALRDDDHALYEIREVARQIAHQFQAKMPLTYAAYEKYKSNPSTVADLEKRLAQYEAYDTYTENIR